ncbi:MAG: hypothetical protein IJH37_00340 [Clostridia bacterium]|nr:hypothetical protein [Clostridia bacterium]
MKSKTHLILTFIVPVCISVLAGIIVVVLNSRSILHTHAASVVEFEKNDMREKISDLKDEKKELERKEAEYTKEISKNELLTSEIEALKENIASYDSDIERVSEKNAELEKSIEEKQSYLDGLSDISADKPGGKYSLKDKDYKCPSDIPAGKYVAKGTGKLYLKDISNRRKDKVDLSTIESNTYTFEIASGESVTVEGTIELTEQIKN